MIGNKIANEIYNSPKKSPENTLEEVEIDTQIPREGYTPPEIQQIIDELKLIRQGNNGIFLKKDF